MKKRSILLLLCVPLAAGLFMCFVTSRPKPKLLIQGRPISDWVRDVELGAFPGETNVAFEVLISTGPRIMPDLSNILLASEALKDIAIRLPITFVPAGTKNRRANESEILVLKAKAANVMGAIAYRNSDTPEVRASIPSLIAALHSGSREVRALSAQALGAIGKGASNAIPALISKTTDEDSGVRMSAVDSIGRIGLNTPAAIGAITQALSDTNRDVSVTAIRSLQTLQRITPSGRLNK
ncbi:MAG: HEAT repeat domain-containing protein [Verrucomicrobia bacterium]|nr:HEAT repeat domain-containing protein [Verrucomicrobiota bacterium]